jgi:hypothetical protein
MQGLSQKGVNKGNPSINEAGRTDIKETGKIHFTPGKFIFTSGKFTKLPQVNLSLPPGKLFYPPGKFTRVTG